MTRVNFDAVAERQNFFEQRVIKFFRQIGFRSLAQQIRSPDIEIKKRVARKNRKRFFALFFVEDDKRNVFGRVSGRVHGAKRDVAKFDFIAFF